MCLLFVRKIRILRTLLPKPVDSSSQAVPAVSLDDLKKQPRKKLFKCNHCGKCFGSSYDLKKHKITHMLVKPFKCDYCSKTFVQSAQLKTHERTHTGEKPFACSHCDKSFRQAGGLKSHERIHTGENHFHVTSVTNVLPRGHVSKYIKELTQERNPLPVTSATKGLFKHVI